jgi:hypothetical protein
MFLSVGDLKVLSHPLHEMIFESSFDHLMEKIRRQELVDVSAWKMCCEWLVDDMKGWSTTGRGRCDVDIQ